MTHYLLSVHGPAEMGDFGNYGSQEAMEAAFAATEEFNDKLRADGYWVFAGGLESASTATVVDGQGDSPVMTDGPYLESKEVIGGFWVIEAPDLDVALKLAAEGSKCSVRGRWARGRWVTCPSVRCVRGGDCRCGASSGRWPCVRLLSGTRGRRPIPRAGCG